MERRGGRPLEVGERILVSYRDDDVWHESVLIPPLTEKSWLIVTQDGDLYTEKIIDRDGETGRSAMRCLRPVRGMGASRDIPPGCVRVHRFATVADEDVLREWISLTREGILGGRNWTYCLATWVGFFPGDATMGFEEFMAGRTRNSSDREMEDETTTCRRVTTKFGFVLAEASTRERKRDPSEHTVLLEEFEGSPSGYLEVRDTGVAPLTCNEDGNWMGLHPERRHGERPRSWRIKG